MGQHPLWRKCKTVVSYGKQAISYEAESPAFRRGRVCQNLNSMHSRAGAQVPFSSLNLGLDTSEGESWS